METGNEVVNARNTQESPLKIFFVALAKLLRMKQWIKNILIFAAPIGAGASVSVGVLIDAVLAFVAISSVSSAIYVINDYVDRKIDAFHPVKKDRPIAAQKFPTYLVAPLVLLLIGSGLSISFKLSKDSMLTAMIYFVISSAYSVGLKRIPVIEIGIVASGYVFRILYGAQIFNLEASRWLLISTFAAAFGIVSAKRKAELDRRSGTLDSKRVVLGHYSSIGLQSLVTMSFGTAFTTYSLWLFEIQFTQQLLPIFCEILALTLFSILMMDSEKGELESPENMVGNRPVTWVFLMFATLNVVLLSLK